MSDRFGLQTFRPDGTQIVGITSRLLRYVDSITVHFPQNVYTRDVAYPGAMADGTWYVFFEDYGPDVFPGFERKDGYLKIEDWLIGTYWLYNYYGAEGQVVTNGSARCMRQAFPSAAAGSLPTTLVYTIARS